MSRITISALSLLHCVSQDVLRRRSRRIHLQVQEDPGDGGELLLDGESSPSYPWQGDGVVPHLLLLLLHQEVQHSGREGSVAGILVVDGWYSSLGHLLV